MSEKTFRPMLTYSDEAHRLKMCNRVCTDNYEIRLADDFRTFDELYKRKEEHYGLTRMVAGYAWNWKSKKDKSAVDIEIEGYKKRWNSVLDNWVHSDNAKNEVGCIHSTQGYDLNYGFVILPFQKQISKP